MVKVIIKLMMGLLMKLVLQLMLHLVMHITLIYVPKGRNRKNIAWYINVFCAAISVISHPQ